jgi:4-hydroxybenzoate polyprenyltransferase/phosphoserine phosphatase
MSNLDPMHIPLVVDLDGTLLKTDSLWESVLAMLVANPMRIFSLLPRLLHNDRAGLKAVCAEYALPWVAFWPFNPEVLREIESTRQAGRKIWLATAAHEKIAEAISARLHCFDGVLATQGNENLKGKAKAEKLCGQFGEKGFDYIGDCPDDLPVWAVCREAVIIGSSEALYRRVAKVNPLLRTLILSSSPAPTVYMRAARINQWLKNILVAVPLLLAHKFTLDALLVIMAAFFSFSLCASAFYLINDLFDLAFDRQHATKKDRPLAAGALHPAHGLALSGLFFTASLGTALMIGPEFFEVIVCYALLTLFYSKTLKTRLILDVVCLGLLYTLRIVAGVIALHTDVSIWILSFSFFIFFGLALIKRLVEIQRSEALGHLPNRAYKFSDRMAVECMAASSGFASIVILLLYIESINAVRLYSHPQFLQAIALLLLYWYYRLLILTHRGEMHDDPVAFVARDKASILCGLAALFVLLIAI